MATQDTSFNAKGQSVVAFETLDDDRDIGAGVFGKKCGVRGEAAGDPALQKGVREVADGTGVHGHGTTQGVFGEGAIGVHALCQFFSGNEVPAPTDAAVVADAEPLVNAQGRSGIGVRAWSAHSRAGVFKTGTDPKAPEFPASSVTAQVHLVPLETQRLPKEGSAGDLLVRMAQDPPDQAELWFCVRSGTSGAAAVWKKVALA